MGEQINLAIVINLVDDILVDYQAFSEELSKNKIKFIKQFQEIAHVTLCVGEVDVDKVELIYIKLKEFLQDEKKFYIKTKGLGVFIDESINLHIRWETDIYLIEFKNSIENILKSIWKENNKYNNNLNWQPKSSIAYKDLKLSDFPKMNMNQYAFKNKKMQVRELSIIEFKVEKKEKVIKKLILNGD